jgi:hypothetical protein
MVPSNEASRTSPKGGTYLYSPRIREEVFSEIRIQSVAFLCVRTGAEPYNSEPRRTAE